MPSLLLALVLSSGGTTSGQPPRLVLEPSRTVDDRLGGGSRSFRIASQILGQERRVFVHLPASFERSSPARRYPTVVAFDGEFLLRPLVVTSEALVAAGQIPEAVIVAVENLDDFEGRVHDLTPPGLSVSGSSLEEGGDRFLDFLERELLPALDTTFRTGEPRVLVGTSSGGVLATYAAATRPAFRFFLALDVPAQLGARRLEQQLLRRAASGGAPLRYASLEARFGWSEAGWKALTDAAPGSWLLFRSRLERERHESMQLLGGYLGLRELFRDYSMLAAPEAPTTSILPAYEKLAAAYGAAVTPPEPLMRQVIEDLLLEGRGAMAHATFDSLVSSYGQPRAAAQLRARIATVERLPPPSESVESLLAHPFPTVEEARDYLGAWQGEQWIQPAAKNPIELQLVAAEGRVDGKLVHRPAPGVELVQPLVYLAVTREGLTFGVMNGMRPRGVLLHEGRRDGDTLSGEVRFGGIRFVPEDGHVPPRLYFRMRRADAG